MPFPSFYSSNLSLCPLLIIGYFLPSLAKCVKTKVHYMGPSYTLTRFRCSKSNALSLAKSVNWKRVRDVKNKSKLHNLISQFLKWQGGLRLATNSFFSRSFCLSTIRCNQSNSSNIKFSANSYTLPPLAKGVETRASDVTGPSYTSFGCFQRLAVSWPLFPQFINGRV